MKSLRSLYIIILSFLQYISKLSDWNLKLIKREREREGCLRCVWTSRLGSEGRTTWTLLWSTCRHTCMASLSPATWTSANHALSSSTETWSDLRLLGSPSKINVTFFRNYLLLVAQLIRSRCVHESLQQQKLDREQCQCKSLRVC